MCSCEWIIIIIYELYNNNTHAIITGNYHKNYK